jgi:hypothetical protein
MRRPMTHQSSMSLRPTHRRLMTRQRTNHRRMNHRRMNHQTSSMNH